LAGEPDGAPSYETVVVGAPRVEQTPREDVAASCSVVTQDRTPRAGESVPQLLSEQSGVSVTRLGGMGSTATVSLRGSTSNQVLVYLDGVPLNAATGGGVDLGAIPLGDVGRIEIYRGMSPIGFGASGIGGVVSITSAVPRDSRADVDLGGGSFGTYYGGLRGAWNRGRWHLYGGIHGLSTDGDFPYVDQTTQNAGDDRQIVRRRNNDLHQVDGTVRAVLDLPGERRLVASVLFFGRDQGLPGLASLASLANPSARLGSLRATGILAYESTRDLGLGSRLRATVYGNDDRSHFQDLDHQIGASSTDAHDRTATLGGTLAWRRPARDWLIFSGVLDARYDRFRPSDALASGAPATRLFGAAGLESDLRIERIRADVIASLRVEAAREETSGRDYFDKLLPTSAPTNHFLPIARLSLVKDVTGWLTLRANGGRYARLPSTVELYGNTGYLLGDPTLKPETGFNADAGPLVSWQRGSSKVHWSTAAFASVVSDLIQYQFGGGRARPQNLGRARILGVESEAVLEIGRHARVVAAVTFTDARNTSPDDAQNGRQLPLRPRYRFYARPEWRAIRIGAQVALGVYGEIDATAGNYYNLDNSHRVPARLLCGLGTYADLPAHFSVRVSGQNLGNSSISDFAGYPLPGREVYLTLAWSSAANHSNNNTKE
jgi:iron complex outermembrane receptor protein